MQLYQPLRAANKPPAEPAVLICNALSILFSVILFFSFIEIIFSLLQDILFAFILLIYYNDDRLLYR